MCIQCMAGAMAAASGATGARAWLAAQPWAGPKLLKRATITLLAAAVLAASTLLSGSGATPEPAPTRTTAHVVVR